MKLPRKVRLGSRDYTVKRVRSRGTGWGRGDIKLQKISVGSGDKNDRDTFSTFVHEITELTMLEEGTRFNRDGEDDFVYIVTHKELDNITEDIAGAIYPMVNK